MKLIVYGHIMSVKHNPITSGLKYCFVKWIVIPQTRVNENPYSACVCIHDDGSISTSECSCAAGPLSPYKHVFAILNYIENKVTVGLNKTCTSKKKKWDVHA